MNQRIITQDDNYKYLKEWLCDKYKVLVVCDKILNFLKVNEIFSIQPEKFVFFNDFIPNPVYESVVRGVEVLKSECCDGIIAVGGGSAIDVAKCIKLYSSLPGDGKNGDWLKCDLIKNDLPFLAIPTTAGTGSEATRFAVIYYKDSKQSITSESCIPDTVLMDSSVLLSLPLYQKKATMCDALCHSIESFWSVNSTEESKELSRYALKQIVNNMDGYLNNTSEGNAGMMMAAHIAGKAINISQTTAGHAMCYKITSLFGCAHGHSAILCDRVLFRWMIDNTDKCVDIRGEDYLSHTLDEIGIAMGCLDAKTGAKMLNGIFDKLEFCVPIATEEQFKELNISVNPVRLQNHPILLTEDDIEYLYRNILR